MQGNDTTKLWPTAAQSGLCAYSEYNQCDTDIKKAETCKVSALSFMNNLLFLIIS